MKEEKIKKILSAGMFAPSAHNSQPWEFIIVRNKHNLLLLSKIVVNWAMLPQADAAIITVSNNQGYKANTKGFFIHDCAAATQNMLLAAHALGLGSVWLGLYGKEKEMCEVRGVLNIPEDIMPFSIIPLGYPAEDKHPHSTYREEKVHFEKYER